MNGGRAAIILLALWLLTAAGAESTASAQPVACQLEAGPTRAVVKVLDGETLALDDGSEVRLIGALAPRGPDSAATAEAWLPERDAQAALERLVLGQSVELKFAGRRSDRYGRTLAHVFRRDGESQVWLQADMLRNGHARAYVLRESVACMEDLLAAERLARETGAGLWNHAAYQVRQAADVRELLRFRGSFQIVEGQVLQAADVRGQVFLNFGENWREDFTVMIRPAERRAMAQAGLDPKSLEGRRIRVRGWIIRRSGPAIEIDHHSQIERLGD